MSEQVRAHQMCADGHVCAVPSGRVCAEPGCDAMAGTLWGPYWCPEHDEERFDRISRSFEEIAKSLAKRTLLERWRALWVSRSHSWRSNEQAR